MSPSVTQVLLGSVVLSAVHAAIPSHWVPLVAVGKAEGWARSEILLVTGITGVAHAAGTILIGVVVGLVGYGLSGELSVSSFVTPAVLLGLGVVYLVLDRRTAHRHRHGHAHERAGGKASKISVVVALSVAMFLSPCIEIEAYYFTAGFLGWRGILMVSAVYLAVTVAGMVLLVDLGLRGASRIRSHYLEDHGKRVTGLVLVALGVLTLVLAL